MSNKKCAQLPKNVEPFDDLCPAWTKGLDWAGDVRFVWHLIGSESAIVPVYLCPDDLDFSCIVLVVEVQKTDESVYWKRAGYVNHTDFDFQEEKECGILYTPSYTDDDWEKYGDNIALAQVDSDDWVKWVSENWDEELFRRRMNYTYRKYQQDGTILWFADIDFRFERTEYEMMVKEYLKYEKNDQ